MSSHESPETIERLKQMLQYYRENQSKFGKRFNLDQSYLSTIINGRRKISGTVLKAMARQNVDIRWLLTGQGEMFMSQGYVSSSDQESSEVINLKGGLILALNGKLAE